MALGPYSLHPSDTDCANRPGGAFRRRQGAFMSFRSIVVCMSAVCVTVAAQAAEWQKVAVGKGEQVEFDPRRIGGTAEGRLLAWSRLVLKKDLIDGETGEPYNTVEAQNSYDCAGARFTTIKRLYLLGDKLVRAEPVYARQEMPASKGGADAVLLAQVCSPQNIARYQAPRPTEKSPAGFGVMHAEMVTDGKGPRNLTVAVGEKAASEKPADGKAVDKPVEKAAEAPAKSEPPKRLLELPKIDKSQIERPTDDAKAAAKADTKAEIKADAKAGSKTITPGKAATEPPLPAVDRHSRELALATSGLVRPPRRKASLPAAEESGGRDRPWSYDGETGPANWARLDPRYALCSSGKRQSPIDIADGVRVDLEAIKLEYRPSPFRIEDNGHTLQVSVGEGNTLSVMGRRYELKQMQFHRPAEERIEGKRYDMSVHLVHRDDEGNVAVLAVMLEKGTVEHPTLQTLWNNLPLEVGMTLSPTAQVDPGRLLPERQAYYTYMGSLTMPPCTENVLWMVLKQPIQISAEQAAIFARLYRNNARPVQAVNGRLIKESR